jgi:hypothetical protein
MAWMPEFEKKLVGKKSGNREFKVKALRNRGLTEDYCLLCCAPLTIIAAKAGAKVIILRVLPHLVTH